MRLFTDKRWFFLLMMAISALLAAIVTSSGISAWIAWPVALFIGGTIWYVIATAIEGGKKYVPEAWQIEIKPDEDGCNISMHDFNRLRWIFIRSPEGTIREDQISLVTRKHWMYLLNLIFPVALIAVALIVACFFVLTAGRLAGLFLLAPLPLLLIIGLFRSWKWRYYYVLVTNLHVILAYVPPRYLLPFRLKVSVDKVPHTRIDNARDVSIGLGNTFHYGTVSLDTPSSADVAFNDIFLVPYPEAVSKLIGSESIASRELGSIAGDKRSSRPRWRSVKADGGSTTQPIQVPLDDERT